MNPTGFSTMTSSIEFANNYTKWIIDQILPCIGATVLEIGTGQGNFTNHLFPLCKKMVSIDIDAAVIERAQVRYPAVNFDTLDVSKQEFVGKLGENNFDTVLCLNVLEHIKNDENAVRNIIRVIKKGGKLFLLVPAIPMLYNSMDELAGHYRRYSKKMMEELIINQQGKVVDMYFFNPIGGIGWFVNKFIKHNDLDSRTMNAQVKVFDRLIVPISRLINPIFKCCFGQSLIAIVRKD